MDGIYENIEEYNRNKKQVLMILFDDMIFTLPYFAVPKNIRRKSTHYCIMKMPSKEELQQIAFNHKSYINFRNFWIFTKMYCQTIFALVTGTTFASDNPLRFRKNLLERI